MLKIRVKKKVSLFKREMNLINVVFSMNIKKLSLNGYKLGVLNLCGKKEKKIKAFLTLFTYLFYVVNLEPKERERM